MTLRVSAGRPERPIDEGSLFAEFATGLRALRADAGLTVRDLAGRTGYSAAAISAAASGMSLPSLPLTMAFARSCGGDPEIWAKLWRQLAAVSHDSASTATRKNAPAADPAPDSALEPSSLPVGSDSRWLGTVPGLKLARHRAPMAFGSITPAAARVVAPSGRVIAMPEGSRLVFGRGPNADLAIAAGRGLSRRAGVISTAAEGVWIANISRTHALYAEGDGYRIRLPRMEQHGEPSGGWFVRVGMTLVGSRSMLDEGKAVHVIVARQGGDLADPESAPLQLDGDGEATLLPLYLDPMTKLFLVALMWCQPWLENPSRTAPLPRTPEIARAALEATGAYHELERFDGDPVFRDRLSARVAEHVKVLRRKISDRGLVRADTRLSDEVVVQVLLEHGIITVADLARLGDAAWCSRQEGLWWTQEP